MERGREREPVVERNYPKPGIYEHYKSTAEDPRYYQVLFCARHTERDEELVVYVPLHEIQSEGAVESYVRPVDMFYDEVVGESGEQMPRFRYIGESV